jgi:hypothetical protein
MYGLMIQSIPEVARAQIEERRREADRYHLGRLAQRIFKRSTDVRRTAAGALPLGAGGTGTTPALGVR